MAVAARLTVAPAAAAARPRGACAPAGAAASASPVTVSLTNVAQKRLVPTTITTPAIAAVIEKKVVDEHAAAEAAPKLASSWREVQGASDWRGMVEPKLHPLLLGEVVRYGELVGACYRAFDLDPTSKRYLNCKHGKKRMLPAVGLPGAGYTVTKYIYAAPDVALPIGAGRSSGNSRWIGYVAVASDSESSRLGRRDILVAFRGTVTRSEWLANFMSSLAPARFDPADPRPDVRVESGFLSLYTSDDHSGKFTAGSCRNQLLSEISRLVAAHDHDDNNISITLAGHSMGSSLAVLLGYDLAELGLNRRAHAHGGAIPITVFSFAGPRVGNLEFKNRCDELGLKVLRVANVHDPVTKMPGVVFNENARAALGGRCELPWSKACYAHVGVEVALDFFKAGDVACVHDLQAYIDHLLKRRPNDDDDAIAGGGGNKVRREDMVACVLESWRWQMAAIRAGEWMQVLGI